MVPGPFELPSLQVSRGPLAYYEKKGDEGTKKTKVGTDRANRKRTLSMDYVHEPCILWE